MRQLYPDLWQSEQGSHFGMDMRTYLLATDDGNVLLYYSNAPDEIAHIKTLGSPKYQYISHHHEFMPAMFANLSDFDAIVCIHRNAVSYLKQDVDDMVIFNETTQLSSRLKAIFTPGHTDNNMCFYYRSPFGKSYLFTGDTIYLDNGKWNFIVMPHDGGNYSDLKQSLMTLRQLEVDVIMPSVGVGGNRAVEVTQKEWHQIIDKLVERL
ncbi:MBL fold metallo-hydrolase [Leptobacterium flavescens]|uniref:MBL fold metallo-hydrolase n=1 Tax=Leptobacterium flavescens TaxID=472055 RepID=A0A6P0UU71_9FLAO|nr:MBL fold metallo-hydrolase [Leptobacterium flavescens]NER15379.1 MBL fold metallo-hydrolase [Leptobacterium flavescens]